MNPLRGISLARTGLLVVVVLLVIGAFVLHLGLLGLLLRVVIVAAVLALLASYPVEWWLRRGSKRR